MYKTYFLSKASISQLDKDKDSVLLKGTASVSDATDQKDLLKMVSVLVSTGINKNDDVYLRDELIQARSTAAHKPVNLGHDENKIIGHMVNSYVADKMGTKIEDDIINSNPDQVPQDIDIIDESVIYKFVFKDLAQKIIEKANAGELFVSVEAWFPNYDYLIGDKIVKRNKETANILDPLLKINGGEGVYRGQRIGRVLRNILLGGKAITETPANPESVIKSVASIKNEDVISIDNLIITNNVIGNVHNLAIASKKENNMNKAQLEEMIAIINAYKGTIASIGELETKVGKLTGEKEELANKLKGIEMEKTIASRKEILKTMGFSETFIIEQVKATEAMSSEDFAKHVETLKSVVAGISNAKAEEIKQEPAKQEVKEEIKAEVKQEAKIEEKPAEKVETPKVETPVAQAPVKQEVKEVTVEVKVEPKKEEKPIDTKEIIENAKVIDPVINVITSNNHPDKKQMLANVLEKIMSKRDPRWDKNKKVKV